ncbi:hypothetical protein [Oceanobacillus sp. CF4.6]|uniref:hypothetical protein n=1 Tax=Oceanobacillus sp. CF4.6 TaxID=3373080 RepID=UPI003EE43AEC
MKKLSLVWGINFVLGIIFLLLGLYLFIQELSEGISLKDFPQSIAFILIGITIFLSASFYKKEG